MNEPTAHPATPAAALSDRRHSIRRRWIVAILLLVLAGAVPQLGLSYVVAAYVADLSGRGWLGGVYHTTDVDDAAMVATYQKELRLRALATGLAEAMTARDAGRLTAIFADNTANDEVWLALDPRGAPLAGNALECATTPALLASLRRPDSAPAVVLCADAAFLLVARAVGPGASAGWILVGRHLGQTFVDELATLSNTEVTLLGPRGQLGTSARSKNGEPILVGLDAALARAAADGGAGEMGIDVHTLLLPGYRGFSVGGKVIIHDTPAALEAYVGASPLPGVGPSPLRLLMWVPSAFLRLSVFYTTILMAAGTLLVCIILAVVGWRLTARFTRPLSGLADAALRIAAGDLDVAVPLGDDQETARLAEAFNAMAESVRKVTGQLAGHNVQLGQANAELQDALARERDVYKQLLQAGKLAAVGTLVAGLSHELNNPIAVIVGYVQGLLKRVQAGDASRPALEAIERQARRCAGLVKALLDFSRRGPTERVASAPAALIDRVAELAAGQARHKAVTLAREGDAAALPAVDVAAQEMESALLNLVTNALDATPRGGQVALGARARLRRGAFGVELWVRDTGSGISDDALPRIFDPFFTTKAPGEGTGLGLPLTRQIVEAHGGVINAFTTPGTGTTMVIWLPAHATPEAARTGPPEASRAA
ncbi:MAG TPA: ATP-binding protein [Myxococcota bacterium]|jgi:signal transduction histidine kinase|nr:ATP-binding protein [Myxococcota bacterium]